MKKLIAALSIILSLGCYGQSVEKNAKDYLGTLYTETAIKLDSAQFYNKLDSVTLSNITALEIVITSTTGDFLSDREETIMYDDGSGDEVPNNGNLTSTRKTNFINYNSDAQSGEGKFLYYKIKTIEESSPNLLTGSKYTYKLTILVGDEYSLF